MLRGQHVLLGGVRVPGWRLRAGRRGGEWHAAAVDPRCAHHTRLHPPALAPARTLHCNLATSHHNKLCIYFWLYWRHIVHIVIIMDRRRAKKRHQCCSKDHHSIIPAPFDLSGVWKLNIWVKMPHSVPALAVCCSLHLSPSPIMESEYSDPGLRQKRRISSSNPMTSWQKADTFPFMLSYISIIGKGEWRQMLDTLRLCMFQFFTVDNCVWWLVDGVIQLDTTEFDFTNPSFPQSVLPHSNKSCGKLD